MVIRPFLFVLACLFFVIAACGGDGAADECECSNQTVLLCSEDGQRLITSVPTLACQGGECVTLDSEQQCDFGCAAGACRSNDVACDDVTCDAPPDNFCEGNQTIVYLVPGSCGTGGACTYDRRRESCDADSMCLQGECRAIDCSFTTCDAPPSNLCEGSTALVYPALGQCTDDTDGPTCGYEPTRRDCTAESARCENGRCIDLCGGVTCLSPPAPSCDGEVAVSSAARGECEDGSCDYAELRQDCGAASLVCERGGCVPLCADDECISPPVDACSDDRRERIIFERVGQCDETETCAYEERPRVDCTLTGDVCVDGDCIVDPLCVDVDCSTPPNPISCEGDVAVRLSSGVCAAGECEFARNEVDCAAAGLLCIDGTCVDRCAIDACLDPPLDICVGDAAWQYGRPGSCDAIEGCDYPLFVLDCAARGETCVHGQCESLCDCTDVPTDRRCEANFVVGFVASGVCEGEACVFDEEVLQDCSDTGGVCSLGVCAPDCGAAPCLPLEPRCEGDNRVVSSAPGLCLEGDVCDYTAVEQSIDCRADGLACVDGACVDACEFLACDTRPVDLCDGDTLMVSTFPSFCEASACQFEETRIDCTVSGDVCSAGACVDPCVGILCNEPPANTCDGSVVEAYRPVGACTNAVCDYGADSFDCSLLGQACVDASCVDPCADVVCEDLPADACEDGVARRYSGESVCSDGVCEYLLVSSSDCGAIGLNCIDAACVDACDGVVCNTPPAGNCLGDVSVTFAVPGTCDMGDCEYVESEVDCSLFAALCDAGSCDDRCTLLPCPTPDDYCAGNSAVSYAATTCAFGTCTENETITDCGDIGLACVDGACLAAATPCDVIDCEPLEDGCASDNATVAYSAPGVCDALNLVCDYSAVRVETACAVGETCVLGSCARHAVAGDVIIAEIFFDADGSDDALEWIELLNVSQESVSLRGLLLISPTGQALALPADAELAPGAVFLVSADPMLTPDQSITFLEFSVPNLGGELALVNFDSTIDSVLFSRDTGWSWQLGRSLSLREGNRTEAANNSAAAWCVPTNSYGRGLFGTPGDVSDGC
ncbi:MAG: hypothetical protein ACI81R_002627 [Bradymonadia bacterium]|jgi:hypothetical protein